MRDNHLHPHFSYDSDAHFEDYLAHYDGDIVTTEHYDLSNPYTQLSRMMCLIMRLILKK